MLFYRLCLGIGTIIGACTCLGSRFCNLPEWDTVVFDSLTNVVLIHDIIAGIWVLVCVEWKILIPLWKYLDMNSPFFEGKLLKNDTPSPRLMQNVKFNYLKKSQNIQLMQIYSTSAK